MTAQSHGNVSGNEHPRPAEVALMGLLIAGTTIPPATIVGVQHASTGGDIGFTAIWPVFLFWLLGYSGIDMLWKSLSQIDESSNLAPLPDNKLRTAHALFCSGTFLALTLAPVGIMGLVLFIVAGSEPTLGQLLEHSLISITALLLGLASSLTALFALHRLHKPERDASTGGGGKPA
jgi:hypothetical protein